MQPLTQREREVYDLITCDAMPEDAIAKKLNISINTVGRHKTNIFDKMGASSVLELAVWRKDSKPRCPRCGRPY